MPLGPMPPKGKPSWAKWSTVSLTLTPPETVRCIT